MMDCRCFTHVYFIAALCYTWRYSFVVILLYAYLQDLSLFKTIVKDMFASLPVPPEPKSMSARVRNSDVEAAIESQAIERGLVAHRPWIDKCLQLYTVSTVSQGADLLNAAGTKRLF